MKCYIFSIFDNFVEDNFIQNEFLEKHLILKDFVDDITLLTFNHDVANHPIVKKMNVATKKIRSINDFPLDGDLYFTFGTFIGFEINTDYYKTKKINKSLVMNAEYLRAYEKINIIFNQNEDLKLYQFMSDPMDFIYDRAKVLTPDSKVIENQDYFPLYQYYHLQHNEVHEKTNKFIVGSTCLNDIRRGEFDKFCLNTYIKNEDNDKYKFYVAHYVNSFFSINNFIEHDKFFDEISKSEFGLVLTTYARDVISVNKLFQFLSKGCIPLFADGCDAKSKFMPKDIMDKYTVKDGFDLTEKLKNLTYEEALNDFKSFIEDNSIKSIFDIINNYIKNIVYRRN